MNTTGTCPAWASCATCNQPLYPHLCRPTPTGWAHSICLHRKAVDTQTCIRCGQRQRYRLCTDCRHVTTSLGELERWTAA